MGTEVASFMSRFGARLVDNGYPVMPIQPGTKKPGRYRRGAWGDYPAWSRHCDRPTTSEEIDIWSRWPEAGIGIAGGVVAAIDIDVADADAAVAIDRLARERLGDTPAVRIGRPPKRLLVYRAEAPFKGIRSSPIEVLVRGQQFLAYGVHPDTGRPYEWPEESLVEVPLARLPGILEEQARAFIDEAMALVPEHLRPVRLGPALGAKLKELQSGPLMFPRDLRGTYGAIAAALAFIPNADLPYDEWVRIGMALKGALGEEGMDLFAAWSAQSAKNVPETTSKAWASFRPTVIGAGTIYHHAIERGWRPDPALVLNGKVGTGGHHPARTFLDKLDAASPTAPASAAVLIPFEMTDPGGVLGEMIGYMRETARRPQPVLALGASLCALGALMGRKYRTASNLRSNLYIVGIADSGSGKNHAREVINELFVEARLGHYLGGNKIASGAGLLTAIHRQPAILFQLDEFGMFLAAAADRKRSPRHVTEILDNMTELYTAAGGIFLGAEYANRDGKNERRDINQPCLCVYGTTTPLHFWNALQSTNVVDGSLARFIIVQTDDDYPEENLNAGIRRSPAHLLDALRAIAGGGGRARQGNLAGLTSDPAIAVDPLTVPMEPAAHDVFSALSRDITKRLKETRGTPFTSILARVAENAAKVALVRAVSLDPAAPTIRVSDAEWAIAFVRHFAERTIVEVERNVADNETERNHKRVLEAVRAAGMEGLTKSDLIRRTQFLDKRQREEVMASLVEAGLVATVMKPTATKPALAYRAVDGSAS